MNGETDMGGRLGQFPETRRSLVIRLANDDSEESSRAWEKLVCAYWKPTYRYLRLRWNKSNEDAKDLVQDFFARALEKDFFASFDPAKGRFRGYFRACVEAHCRNDLESSRALKRGGHQIIQQLDFEEAEGEISLIDPPDPGHDDEWFDKEWRRQIFSLAIENLQSHCLSVGDHEKWQVFLRYDLATKDRPRYEDLAREFDVPITAITNWLSAMRGKFRNAIVEILKEQSNSEQEFQDDLGLLEGHDRK